MSVILSKQVQIPSLLKKASDLPVGSSVYLMLSSKSDEEFIVIHQGNPDSSLYDDSCNGTWLLIKRIINPATSWSNNNNDYENSYMNTNDMPYYYSIFGNKEKSVIKEVKIPYRPGSAKNNWDCNTGTNGLLVHCFLLSGYEVGFSETYMPRYDGTKLDYFISGASGNSKRIASANGMGYSTAWWLRSPYVNLTNNAYTVYNDGSPKAFKCTDPYYWDYPAGTRFAIIIDSSALFDKNGFLTEG